jgi:hypothetical protein
MSKPVRILGTASRLRLKFVAECETSDESMTQILLGRAIGGRGTGDGDVADALALVGLKRRCYRLPSARCPAGNFKGYWLLPHSSANRTSCSSTSPPPASTSPAPRSCPHQ